MKNTTPLLDDTKFQKRRTNLLLDSKSIAGVFSCPGYFAEDGPGSAFRLIRVPKARAVLSLMMIYAQRKLPSFWIVGLIDLLLVIAMVCVVIIPNLTNKLAILAGLISGVVTVILVPMTGVLSDSLSTYQAALNKCRAICNSITKSKFDEQHFLALVYGLGADEWGDFISKFDR
jgi:hypothetical protein